MSSEERVASLRRHERPLVVDCWAPWCRPCRVMEPVLAEISVRYADRVDSWKVNVDTEADLASTLAVHAVPTLVAFRGGREVGRLIGAQSRRTIERLYDGAVTGEYRPAGVAGGERVLRSFAGLVLVAMAWRTGAELLYLLGGVILFSAVYDLLRHRVRPRR